MPTLEERCQEKKQPHQSSPGALIGLIGLLTLVSAFGGFLFARGRYEPRYAIVPSSRCHLLMTVASGGKSYSLEVAKELSRPGICAYVSPYFRWDSEEDILKEVEEQEMWWYGQGNASWHSPRKEVQ